MSTLQKVQKMDAKTPYHPSCQRIWTLLLDFLFESFLLKPCQTWSPNLAGELWRLEARDLPEWRTWPSYRLSCLHWGVGLLTWRRTGWTQSQKDLKTSRGAMRLYLVRSRLIWSSDQQVSKTFTSVVWSYFIAKAFDSTVGFPFGPHSCTFFVDSGVCEKVTSSYCEFKPGTIGCRIKSAQYTQSMSRTLKLHHVCLEDSRTKVLRKDTQLQSKLGLNIEILSLISSSAAPSDVELHIQSAADLGKSKINW